MSNSILMGFEEVSALLAVPINTLKDYRAKGKGPRSAVIGGRVKYLRSDVLEWIDEQFAASTKGAKSVAKPLREFSPLGKRSLLTTACQLS